MRAIFTRVKCCTVCLVPVLVSVQNSVICLGLLVIQAVLSTHCSCGYQHQIASLSIQVEEQGELAIRIDENVDETLSNVDSAQDQLLKYLNSISSNRWLIMKIFFVLMVFLVVFVVFVA